MKLIEQCWQNVGIKFLPKRLHVTSETGTPAIRNDQTMIPDQRNGDRFTLFARSYLSRLIITRWPLLPLPPPPSGTCLIANNWLFFRGQRIHVACGRSSSMRQLVNETEQVRLSESQLSKRVRVEEELDQPFAISVRSAATIQVPLLRVQVQGEDRHTKAHQDEAQEQGCLRDRCVPIVATPSVRTRTNLQRIDKFEEKREEIHFSRPSSFDQGFSFSSIRREMSRKVIGRRRRRFDPCRRFACKPFFFFLLCLLASGYLCWLLRKQRTNNESKFSNYVSFFFFFLLFEIRERQFVFEKNMLETRRKSMFVQAEENDFFFLWKRWLKGIINFQIVLDCESLVIKKNYLDNDKISFFVVRNYIFFHQFFFGSKRNRKCCWS